MSCLRLSCAVRYNRVKHSGSCTRYDCLVLLHDRYDSFDDTGLCYLDLVAGVECNVAQRPTRLLQHEYAGLVRLHDRYNCFDDTGL